MEIEWLKQEKSALQSRKEKLQKKVQKNAIYWEFLEKVTKGTKKETTWNHIQSTAAKETLLLGQIKVVTLNLFNMTGGKTEEDKGVRIEDTVQQLDRIQLFIRHQAGIISELQLTYPAANTNIK